jgi:hypothetical protein
VRIGVHAHLSVYLPSRTKLWCMLQLRGQIHSPYYYSAPICTLWFSQPSGGVGGRGLFGLCVHIMVQEEEKKHTLYCRCNWFDPPTSLPPFMLASIESTCHTRRSKTKREEKGCHYYCVVGKGGFGSAKRPCATCTASF